MELIDREALKKAIDEVHQKDLKLNPLWGSIGLNTLNRIIDNAPTVYPKQGEWIKKQVTPASCTYVCSECGIEEVILGNFCCWCGADMRGA